MKISGENEGRSLFLYHLAGSFFHESAKDFEIKSDLSPSLAVVTLKGRGRTARGEAMPNLSLHRERRRSENAALGLAFARAAATFSDYVPPYGTLIGVRPVKVALFYLKSGIEERECEEILKKEFLVSPEKAALLLRLAKTETDFEKTLSPENVCLYVSIPFCPSRCSYCSFISSAAPAHLKMIPDYLQLLEEELRLTASHLRETGQKVTAFYVGGGTPGILKEEELASLLSCIHGHFDLSLLRESCVEMGRPDTVTEGKLSVLTSFGIDRISINSQTTCDETLKRIGRRHTAADFFCAMEKAKRHSFRINCDLISALPGENPETFLRSVRETLALGPDEITLHALCQKKSAEDRTVKTFSDSFVPAVRDAHRLCINAGMAPYYLYRQKMSDSDLENLGFAKAGTLGIYNLAMMEDLTDVYACGAGAISKLIPRENGGKIRRFASYKYPFEYLDHPERIRERLEDMKS